MDEANINSGKCATLTVSQGGSTAEVQVKQNNVLTKARVGSTPQSYKFSIYIPLYESDWNPWNTTLNGQVVPWIYDDDNGSDPVLMSEIGPSSDYMSPITISNDCMEGFSKVKRNLQATS